MVKLVPLHRWPPRLVRWVWWVRIFYQSLSWHLHVVLTRLLYSLPRKLVKILQRVLKTGKVWRSLFSWQFKIVKLLFRLFHQLLPWSSRPSRSPLVIARSRRIVMNHHDYLLQCFNTIFAVKHNGNITFDEVIAIARIMRTRSQSRFLIGTVKEILGTCMVTINGMLSTSSWN